MNSKENESTANKINTQRQPGSLKMVWIIGAVILISAWLIWAPSESENSRSLSEMPTTIVQKGALRIDVTETGTISPRKQIVLKNETDRDATIVFVVQEGSIVEEGQLLVELDSTEVENQLVERRLQVMNDEAEVVAAQETLKVVKNQNMANIEQAELTWKFAIQDLEKYKDGEFPKLRKEAEASLKLAEAELKQAEESLKWSTILYDEKYLSQSELQQDELNKQRGELQVQSAKEDLRLLEEFTYQRQIDQLESDVRQAELALERAKNLAAANLAQAEANLKNEESRLVEEQERLRRDERRFNSTKIYAPIDGRVLYATSVGNRWRRNDEPIDVGTTIDERDEILFLPTASEFNVNIQVTEVELNKVSRGLPVTVTVDALPGKVLTGTVTDIAQFPDPDSRYLNPNLKLYKTVIELDADQDELRNGMSCLAEVLIQDLSDVIYIPMQSVTRRGGKPTVYIVQDDDSVLPQEVKTGMDNARFVHIVEGLKEGQKILLAPPMEDSAGDSEDSSDAKEPSESNIMSSAKSSKILL